MPTEQRVITAEERRAIREKERAEEALRIAQEALTKAETRLIMMQAELLPDIPAGCEWLDANGFTRGLGGPFGARHWFWDRDGVRITCEGVFTAHAKIDDNEFTGRGETPKEAFDAVRQDILDLTTLMSGWLGRNDWAMSWSFPCQS